MAVKSRKADKLMFVPEHTPGFHLSKSLVLNYGRTNSSPVASGGGMRLYRFSALFVGQSGARQTKKSTSMPEESVLVTRACRRNKKNCPSRVVPARVQPGIHPLRQAFSKL